MLIDITYFLRVLKRKIWILIFVPLSASVTTHLIIQNRQEKYKSSAQISAGLPVTLNVANSKGKKVGPESTNVIFLNHVEAMKTGFIGSMVSYRLLLYDLNEEVPFRENGQPSWSPNDRNSANERLEQKLASFETLSPYDKLENKLIRLLIKKDYDIAQWINDETLKIERIGDTNFIRVEFLSENPFLSAFVVNAMSKEYIRYNNSLNYAPNDSLQFLSDLVIARKKVSDAKTERLQRAKSNSKSVVGEESALLNRLAQYEVRLQEETSRVNRLLTSLRTTKSKISEHKSVEKTENADPSKAPKVVELQAKIEELNKIYTVNGSKDDRLVSTINNLRNQLKTELTRLELESNQSKVREGAMQELITEEKKIELEYKQAALTLLSTRTKIDQLRKEIPGGGSEIALTVLEREREQALKDYAQAKERLDQVQKDKTRRETGNGGLKLVVMGQPNAEPESLHATTIVSITAVVSVVAVIVVLLITTLIQTPRRPTTPTFVITR